MRCSQSDDSMLVSALWDARAKGRRLARLALYLADGEDFLGDRFPCEMPPAPVAPWLDTSLPPRVYEMPAVGGRTRAMFEGVGERLAPRR